MDKKIEPPNIYNGLRNVTKAMIEIHKEDTEYRPVKRQFFTLDRNENWIIKSTEIYSLRSPQDYDSLRAMLEKEGPVKLYQTFIAEDADTETPPDVGFEEIYSGIRIATFVDWYIRKLASLEFNEEVFDDCCQKYKEYRSRHEDTFLLTIPLLNFSSERDSVKLDENHKIVRLESSDKIRLANQLRQDWFLTDLRQLDLKTVFESGFAIQVKHSSKREGPYIMGVADNQAQDVLTALRLLAPGDVSLTNFHY